jgi:hypothetical protein
VKAIFQAVSNSLKTFPQRGVRHLEFRRDLLWIFFEHGNREEHRGVVSNRSMQPAVERRDLALLG